MTTIQELEVKRAPLRTAASTIGRRLVLSLCFLVLYWFLNSPSVIIVSHLGFTVWYPATGLIFAFLLGVSPWYMLLAALADTFAGAIIYHQPLHSWSETVGAVGAPGCYAIAAYVLRGPLRIDLGLRYRADVVRYVFVALSAAACATGIGVACLAADHTIGWSQYWSSAAGWYAGDATGLLGFAPFLLVHVLPVVNRKFFGMDTSSAEPTTESRRPADSIQIAELIAQTISIPATLWFVFAGPLAVKQLYFLGYLPIIWIAMRQGLHRVITALVIFNFTVVLILRIFPVATDSFSEIGFLMVVISAVGLIVGSTVTERQRIGRQLTEQTVYLTSLIENSPLGIVVNDSEGRVRLCNDAFESLFSVRREELLGNHIDTFVIPSGRIEEDGELFELASSHKIKASLQLKRKDGHLVDVEFNAVPLVLGGAASGVLSIYTDVSERVQADRRLKEQAEALARSVAELQGRTDQATLLNEMGDLLQSCEASAEAIKVLTEYGGKLFPSAIFGALFLFKSSRNALEIAGKWGRPDNIESTFAPDGCWALRRGSPHWSGFPEAKVDCDHIKQMGSSRDLCIPMMARGQTLGILHLGYDLQADGKLEASMGLWWQSQKLLGTSVATQVGLALTSLRLRESLRDQSIRDPLTGLFNRRFMQESLDRELQRARRKGRPVTVVLVDIDHFKHFNDMFGHDAGDSVLRSFAELMRTSFRGDDVICRHGGEEFALILPESNERDAAARMDDFRKKVKAMSIHHAGHTLDSISVSIGIAAFSEQTSSMEDLLRQADQALYISKTQGRDRITVAK